MNVHDHRFLLSGRETLERLIAQTSTGNVIGSMSLRSRLEQVMEELEAYKGYSSGVASAKLTFRGSPVVDSRGILADFGTEAVNAFAESVTRIGAGWVEPLAPSGRIPNSDEYQLLITGTAAGSFGFHMEDASPQLTLEGLPSSVERAVGKVKEILKATVGTDEDLLEAIADTDRRALDSVQTFLRKTADNGAVCALEFQGDEFRFRDVAQVRHSADRLGSDRILEDNAGLFGKFQGFLPNSRRAEFLLSGTDVDFLRQSVGAVIVARIEPAVSDKININDFLNQDITVTARVKRIGSGRPRYVFTDFQAT